MEEKSKHEKLLDILEGNFHLESTVLRRSHLSDLEEIDSITLPGITVLSALGLAMGIVSCIFMIVICSLLPSMSVRVFGFIFCACMCFLLYRRWRDQQHQCEYWMQRFVEVIEELREVAKFLKSYLADVDTRTSRYFHCMTTTKSTAYFVLTQILRGLEKRDGELGPVIEGGDLHALHAALSTPFAYSDSIIEQSGKKRFIPARKLNPTVLRLIDNLEESLAELEAEINVADNGIPAEENLAKDVKVVE